jgi:hypothetical protein
MALEERDREDLLRDGRQMLVRGESLIAGTPVVIGFRSQGQLSLYCGPDPVFQFNAERKLRRAYFQGRRFSAEENGFVELMRENRGGKVEFVRQPLDPATQSIMLASLSDWLQRIREVAQSRVTLWRVADGDTALFRDRLLLWLEQVPSVSEIANTPNA